jgi:hypothetical protein
LSSTPDALDLAGVSLMAGAVHGLRMASSPAVPGLSRD